VGDQNWDAKMLTDKIRCRQAPVDHYQVSSAWSMLILECGILAIIAQAFQFLIAALLLLDSGSSLGHLDGFAALLACGSFVVDD
jgi:hypothetical protein